MSYPSYPEYKDSDVNWPGAIPTDWATAKLKRAANLITGVTPPSDDLDNYSEEGWPWVTPDDLDEAGKPITASKYVTQQGWGYCRPVKPGATLVCCIGSIGKVGFSNRVISTNQQITALEPACHPRFLFYYMSAAKPELDQEATGNVLRILNAERLGNLSLALPSSKEQTQIARFLDHQTARIDALIAEQQRLIELLKEKRQAVISHAVTNGLDPEVAMKDSGVEWLGEVPAHWSVAPLRWYATVQGGLAKGKTYESNVDTVELPYLRVANVQDGHLDLTDVHTVVVSTPEAERYKLRAGDVLMNEGGDNDKLGRGTVWEGEIEACLHQNHVFAIRPNASLSPEWLALFTKSASARAYFYLYSKQSTNLASVSSSNLMSCPLPLPPKTEQSEIIKELRSRTDKLDRLTETANKSVQLLVERRSALISAAVTGKIDVRDWEPPVSETFPQSTASEKAPA